MSIRPIDTLLMPQRSQEASQVKQVEAMKTPTQQAQIHHSFQSKVQHDAKQTIKSSKSENKEKRYDAKDKGNGAEYNEKNGKKKEEQKDEPSLPGIKTSSFDIKI